METVRIMRIGSLLLLLTIIVGCIRLTPYPGYRYCMGAPYSQLIISFDSLYQVDSSLIVYSKELNDPNDSINKWIWVNTNRSDTIESYYWFNLQYNNQPIIISARIRQGNEEEQRNSYSTIYLRSWAKGFEDYPIDIHHFGNPETSIEEQSKYLDVFEEQVLNRLGVPIVDKWPRGKLR